MTPKIELKHLSMCYGGRQADGSEQPRVIHDVCLGIMPGEFRVFLGASGCGKSTLMNIVAGYLAPTEGCVEVDGRVVSGPGEDRGVVFQNADEAVFPWLTVGQNVAYGLKAKGMPREQRVEAVSHFVGLVGLEGHERKYPSELSGGMRQRLQIARALAVGPEVLIMDEPFGALDAQTRHTLQDELLRIWRATETTILFVTHDISEAIYLGQRVSILSAAPDASVYREFDVDAGQGRDLSSQPLAGLVEHATRWLDEAALIHSTAEAQLEEV